MLNFDALLQVPYVDTEMGFDISPDNDRVAFSWNPNGNWDIFEIPLQPDAKGVRRPIPVSRGPGGKFGPRYSPDGRFLAYAVDFDGSENYHIFLHDFVTGVQTDLTPDAQGAIQPFMAWSPDSTQLAFPYDNSGQFDIFIMRIPGSLKDARRLFSAGFPAWKVAWSPDGLHLAVVVEAGGADYGTFIVSLDGGETVRIGDENGPIDAGQPHWSPDGKSLAFSSDAHGFNNVAIYELATGEITWLTDGNGEKQYPAWSPDGRLLAYVFNHGTVSWLAVQGPDGEQVLHQVEPGVHYWPHFTRDGSRILFGFDNPRHPSDLWTMSLDGQFTQLTHSLPVRFRKTDFLMPSEITYPGLDGVPVPAMLFRPEVQQPGPGVILIHGGPDWHFEMTWYPLMAHMVSRGWTVLVPNYRGSTGYGRAWQNASRYDYGGADADDVTAGAHYLIKEGLADPARIGITGRSHGGYLTAVCMTRAPDLWAVGSAFVPFLNWFANHAEIRPDLQHWDIENFGDPVEDYQRWYDHSPFFFLDRLQAPLQLICGRKDARCPISDSVAAHAELQRMGKVSDLVIYEDEGHIFLKMENVLDSERRRMNFLVKYLEGTRS